jgi:putative addiction module CopG family antidote
MAELVKSKVASGDYANESEVIRNGLRVLMARDRAMENWLPSQGLFKSGNLSLAFRE